MSANPDAERNAAEQAIAVKIMRAINRATGLVCSIPRVRDGTVTMEAQDFSDGADDAEFTIIISRNDRGQP